MHLSFITYYGWFRQHVYEGQEAFGAWFFVVVPLVFLSALAVPMSKALP